MKQTKQMLCARCRAKACITTKVYPSIFCKCKCHSPNTRNSSRLVKEQEGECKSINSQKSYKESMSSSPSSFSNVCDDKDLYPNTNLASINKTEGKMGREISPTGCSPSSFEKKFPSLKEKTLGELRAVFLNWNLTQKSGYCDTRDIEKNCLDKSIVERDYIEKQKVEDLLGWVEDYVKKIRSPTYKSMPFWKEYEQKKKELNLE